MKKKLLAIILATSMALSFTACGNSDTKSKPKEESVNKDQVKDENKLSDLSGKPLDETMDKINELGYTATYFADGVDFTEFIDSMKNDYITGEIKEDSTNKTAEITLRLASDTEAAAVQNTLSQKLEEGSAWGAANKYGKTQYGEGFDLNYLVGKIDASAEDENTWFLKAECTVDGNKMTCEAKVAGTTDSPEVIALDVY